MDGNLRDPGNYAREDFLAYKKGALVAALLDREIMKATGRAKSLADVLNALYARFGVFRGGELSEKVIEEEVARAVGRDITRFFDANVHAVTPLGLDTLTDSNCHPGQKRHVGKNRPLPYPFPDPLAFATRFCARQRHFRLCLCLYQAQRASVACF